MGEFDNATQTSKTHDNIYHAINTLSEVMAWRLEKLVPLKLMDAIPFGAAIFGPLIPTLNKGKIQNSSPSSYRNLLLLEKQAMRCRDEYIQNRIAFAQEKIDNDQISPDLASLLLNSRDQHGNRQFTNHNIACQLYGFLFAGHETTAATMQWILYFLGECPTWAQKINEEFENIGGKINGKTLKKVPITEAVIKETLRIAHVVEFYVPRILKVIFVKKYVQFTSKLSARKSSKFSFSARRPTSKWRYNAKRHRIYY